MSSHGAGSGSPHRPLADPVLQFDLAEEAARLRASEQVRERGRGTVTLVKHPDFRVAFMVMMPGTRLQEHHAHGRLTIQPIAGHVRIHMPTGTIDLHAGHLLALDRELSHDVEAVEESAVILTIAWPNDHRE